MQALLTDAHLRSAVAGIRGLGRVGVRVLALAPGPLAAGLWSRYQSERAVGPDPIHHPQAFVARVAALAAERGQVMVYSSQEAAIDALLRAPRTVLASVVLPYPGEGGLAALRDKSRLPALAGAAGLAVPRTLAQGTADELLAGDVAPPLVLKPARPGGALTTALPVDSRGDLRAVLSGLPADEVLLLQERASGPLTSVSLVVDRDGRLVARFQQRALRTWPLGAGPSSLAVSVAPDEGLVERCRCLLAQVGYAGLAQLQFVGTPRGPGLIDVNTRFYGSLPLALRAGVNLPGAWHAVVVDGALPEPGDYRVGVAYRWLEADLSAALRGFPRLLLYRTRPPRVGSMWAPDDPLASVLLAASAVGDRITRRLPRRRLNAPLDQAR
jgi:predicted ATP-grasp superfamily ATP-dependent carboligase